MCLCIIIGNLPPSCNQININPTYRDEKQKIADIFPGSGGKHANISEKRERTINKIPNVEINVLFLNFKIMSMMALAAVNPYVSNTA